LAIKRRDALKLAAGAGAGIAITGLLDPSPAEASTKKSRLAGAVETTTACNFCSCGCGMVCHVKDGKLINMEGDPDHIINEGALCSKGAAMIATHESPERLTTPMYRAPGSVEFRNITWDEAFDRITAKMKQTRDDNWIATEKAKDKDGKEVDYPVNRTDAISFLGGAQNTNEECYLMGKMARLLGTVWVEHQARL
jgi:formate dehydrogenase major subunit